MAAEHFDLCPSLEQLLGAEEVPSVQEAENIDALVEEHIALTATIEDLEAKIKAAKARRYALETSRLVDAMRGARCEELVTNSMMQLKLNETLIASLPKEDIAKRAAVIDYVRDNGGKDIIKNTIVVTIAGHNQATSVKTFLKEVNLPFQEREDINFQTFNKFCREKLQRDHDLDFDRANAYLQTVVEVKPFTGEKKVKVGRKRT